MDSIIKGIVRRRRSVFVTFIVLALISVWAYTKVGINYDIVSYLPLDEPSTIAIGAMTDNFGTALPNVKLTVAVDELQDALILKEEIAEMEGITDVIWLDDTLDITQPLELADEAIVEGFYKDGYALFQLTGETDNAAEVIDRLMESFPEGYIVGSLVDLASAQHAVNEEVSRIVVFAVPIIIIILLLSTHSWLEPLVFLITIGIGILLNMGSNIILGEISFLTQAVAAILQLAVSMDYAIFLLHSFNDYRAEGHEPIPAMQKAMRRSLAAIFSSSITTFVGFLALLFMRFGLGADLGIVMAKGIAMAFLTVMIFMPTFILMVYPWIEKTRHRSFLPDFTRFGRFVVKGRWAIPILIVLLMVPAFLGSRNNEYLYGMGAYPEESRMESDREFVDELFGQQVQLALMVPSGDTPSELRLHEELEQIPNVINVMSYVSAVDPAIPSEVIDNDQLSMLVSEDYRLFIMTAEGRGEGPTEFAMTEEIRTLASHHYGDTYHLAGEPANMLDMKNTIEADDIIVNGLAILAIALTIMFVYRSLSLPLLLVLTIEVAIWINLSIPYFTGTTLSYIGYLIVSTVQLGATVDYAILYTEHYLENRETYPKREAIIRTTRQAIPSILPPALILTAVGFVLGLVTSMGIVADLGILLGRGAALSFVLVSLFLPQLLMIFDKTIEKTTMNRKLFRDDTSGTPHVNKTATINQETQVIPEISDNKGVDS